MIEGLTSSKPTATPERKTATDVGFLARHLGVVLAVCSFLLTAVWVFSIQPLDASDEVAHLQTVMEVRNGNLLPEIHYDLSKKGVKNQVIGNPGDQSVRNYAYQIGYRTPFDLTPYEAMQPPLFYLVAGFAAKPFPADPQTVLYIARLVAALFGAGAVYFYWAAAKQFAPNSTIWPLAAAGMIALLPQFCFSSATAANDSALNFFVAASFYVWFKGLREAWYDRWMLRAGLLLGLAILSKLTALALIPGLAVVVLFRALRSNNNEVRITEKAKSGLLMGAGAVISATVVCGWWLVRNAIVYGELSGSRDALRFYVGKFPVFNPNGPDSTAQFIAEAGQSLLGKFGWMNRPLPQALYEQAQYIAMGILLITLLVIIVAGRKRALQSTPAYVWESLIVMATVALFVLAGFIQFNLTIARQPQGRYLFPLLLPLALLFTGGFNNLNLSPKRKTVIYIIWVLPFIWLALANLTGLRIVQIPYSSP